WCTRYGDVSELIGSRDEALVLMNGGDELTLKFTASSLPPKPVGSVREFFLYADGWDKDSIFMWWRARRSNRCPSTAWTNSAMAGRSGLNSRATCCTENT